MATKRRKPILKQDVPWWAWGTFAALLAFIAGLLVWGMFYEGG